MDIVEGVAGLTPEQRLANARLIAAAPELLKMLNLARDALRIWAPKDAHLTQIDAVIAKAEGSP